MANERFHHARNKLKRANAHIRDFNQTRAGFIKASPYQFPEEQDAQTGQYRIWCRATRDIASELTDLALVVGDAIHNLRSTYDHVIYQLIAEWLQANPTLIPTDAERRQMGFPTHHTEANLKGTIGAKAKYTRPEVRDILAAIQPCQGGKGHAIWQIEALNGIDKHRLLLTTGGGLDRMGVAINGIPIPIGPIMALKDGEVLLGPYDTPKGDMNGHLAFEISVDEPDAGIDNLTPFVKTLQGFADLTAYVIDTFETVPPM